MDVIVIGAGSSAQLIVSIFSDDCNFNVVGCVDVVWPDVPQEVLNVPIVGDHTVLRDLYNKGVRGAIVAVSDNVLRERHSYALREIGFETINAIHRSVIFGKNVSIGDGVCIGEGCVVSTGTRIADNVFMDAGSVLGSLVDVGPNVYVGNGVVVGAGAIVEKNCFLDAGATIGREITVGKNVTIASGERIVSNISGEIAAENG